MVMITPKNVSDGIIYMYRLFGDKWAYWFKMLSSNKYNEP